MIKTTTAAIFILLVSAHLAKAADYCLAIRGNGELEPAHWGAISHVVERLGLPKMQAGGSSASITMYLLDSMAANPTLPQAIGDQRRLDAGLLVKSLVGFSDYLQTKKQFRDFLQLYKGGQQVRDISTLEDVLKLLDSASQLNGEQLKTFLSRNAMRIKDSIATAEAIGLINKENVNSIVTMLDEQPLSSQNLAKSRFYVSELIDSIILIGKFSTTGNLFFRPGIIDFDQFASQVGRIGDFYRIADWTTFFSECSQPAYGVLWSDLVKAHPQCQRELTSLIKKYFKTSNEGQSPPAVVGAAIPSFPSTTVLIEGAQQEVGEAFVRYKAALVKDFEPDFQISDPEQIRFGYWGREELLEKVRQNLNPEDEKSRRFLSLGSASWLEVLRLSPAEPGLSPLRFFSHGEKTDKRTYVSAGGWADLAPVAVLKAAGCQNVIYVTRRGAESEFAEGVARRLFGTKVYDGQGIGKKLFDLNSSDSSFKRSLKMADAVKCTNWNAHEITQGIQPMLVDAYSAPYLLNSRSGLLSDKNLSPRILEPLSDENSKMYFGCF